MQEWIPEVVVYDPSIIPYRPCPGSVLLKPSVSFGLAVLTRVEAATSIVSGLSNLRTQPRCSAPELCMACHDFSQRVIQKMQVRAFGTKIT